MSYKEAQIKKLNQIFIWLTWRITRRFSTQLQSFGLTQSQYLALVALSGCHQAYTMGELAELTLETPSTLTGIIDRLVKMELVQRNRCEEDRRTVWICATQTGHGLVARIEEEIMKDDAGFAGLSEVDMVTLERLLTHILIPSHLNTIP